MTKESIKKKIAIVHPSFYLGGAGAVAIWIIESLKSDYHIDFIITEEINLNEVNNFFGTQILPSDINIINISPFLGRFKSFLLKIALTERYYKKKHNRYDLAIATRCEMDLGERIIQYINIPIRNEAFLRKLNQLPNRIIYREGFLRKLYILMCQYISQYSEDRMKRNYTIVNSEWTGNIVKQLYNIETQVLYPPVNNDFKNTCWESREDGFICIGAITPGKQIEQVIEIIKQVRISFPFIHLHVIGNVENDASNYALKIFDLCKKYSKWLSWEKNLSRKEIVDFLSKHKYGIHGMKYEHFGIVIAEMVQAGCIPFVPSGGGQVEIVKDNRLIYQNSSDAVKKISYVLDKEMVQKDIQQRFMNRSNEFSSNIFIKSIKTIVENFKKK